MQPAIKVRIKIHWRNALRRVQGRCGRADARYLFSANGAGSFEPGATPQELIHLKSSALKARFIAVQTGEEVRREASGALNRAFSARVMTRSRTWGVAPGWIESAPLALNRYARSMSKLPAQPQISWHRATERAIHL